MELAARLIPFGVFDHLRAVLYRWAGFDIGPRVRLIGPLTLRGSGDIYSRLSIGSRTAMNSPAYIDLNAPVRIGANCGFGHHLVLITTNHALGPASQRIGANMPAGITIGDGAWIAACVTILPGVTIGAGAFVGAGSVVSRDVPVNARVVGNPARLVRTMDDAAPAPRPQPTRTEKIASAEPPTSPITDAVKRST